MATNASTVVAVGALLLACACTKQDPARAAAASIQGPTMGSTFEVKFFGSIPRSKVEEVVTAELAAFDLAFSNWRDDSEIAKVNAHASTEPLAVSKRFAQVLALALRIAKATDGAFDPTLKPLSDLYRAAKKNGGAAIGDDAVAVAKQRVDYRLVSVVDGKLVKQRPDVQLDLDGLVAGAAADAIAARLDALGVKSYYLEITGEVLCRGKKPTGPWRIGVVDPESAVSSGQRALRTIPLDDRALCSSGDYRNATIVDGEVVHHVFDPRTGRNPTHRVVSASVLAKSCAVADALGTALMVMGDEAARRDWSKLETLGAEGALLVKPGEAQTWQQVEIAWPEDS